TLEMDSELKAEHFTLENPDRLVVDIEGVTMSSTIRDLISKVRPNDPYIDSVRVAQNRPDVIRLVMDLKQPIAPQVFTLKPIGDYKYRLVLDLYPKIAQDPLLAIMDSADTDPLAELLEDLTRSSPLPDAPVPSMPGQTLPPFARTPRPTAPAPKSADPPASRQPLLIALDPGHGGEDPG